MLRKGMTVREAAHEWVREMNAIQQGIIAKLMNAEPWEWNEVTLPCKNDRVYVYEIPEDCSNNYGEIIEYSEEDDIYSICLDDGVIIEAEEDEFEVRRDSNLPMWSTMWSFGDNCDDYWIDEYDGIRKMSECGFRIYQSEEFGYFFGIDGAGYDFYESHWIPLYRKRGLKWHDETESESEVV